jgi:glyoxylase-like metal-dependent hydrolase (beta-lactamase superfamily II)
MMTAKPDVMGFFDGDTATWSYVVWDAAHPDKLCAVIDSVLDFDPSSGRTRTDSADRIVGFVQENGLKAEWILETHIHADHLTAAAYLKEKLGGRTAISRHILKVIETWEPVFNSAADTPRDGSQFDRLFSDDETFRIGDIEARIFHTPGHTPSDTSYLVGDALFTGDAIFLPDVGTGRCDFPGGDAAQSWDSTRKILALPDDTRMFVGHDYPPEGRGPACMTTVAEQKRANVRAREGVGRDEYAAKRRADDAGKPVPRLLLPALQVNLRAGAFGQSEDGVRYVKIPVDKI